MLKNEFFLQVMVFGMTAGIISLLAMRLIPANVLSPEKVFASPQLIDPIPISANLRPEVHPPTAIMIPSIDLHLPIAPGVISNNEWTLFDDKVSWLSSSKTAGLGNMILYAHNRVHLFAGLKNLKVGDEIVVEQDGKNYSYEVSETRKVLPNDLEAVLSPQDQLTLYTCDGSFDQKRLIVIALPKSEF